MNKHIKALIKSAEYDERRDLVSWFLEDTLTGETITLAWRGTDLNQIFGVTKQIPPDMIRQFCRDMEGQVRKFEMQTEVDDPRQVSIEDKHDIFSKYPFYEVEDKLKSQNR